MLELQSLFQLKIIENCVNSSVQEDREDARTGYGGLANERVLIVILNENVQAKEFC